MRNIRIIAKLEIKGSNLVKGYQFEGLRKIGNPSDFVLKYYLQGADEIFCDDIVASLYERNSLLDIIDASTNDVFIPITVGGGIRSIEDVTSALNAGADKVSINTAAIKNPELIKEAALQFGSQCIVVAIDAKHIASNKWGVFTHGGREATGLDALEFALLAENNGAGEILLTSMDKDGTKSGYDLQLTKSMTNNLKIPVVASGGVGTLEHIKDGIVKGGASAVLAASIFHFGEFSISQVKEYLNSENVPVRI